MSHSEHKFDVKPVIYGFLSFMLAFMLFLLSICLVLQFTLFSEDFMLNAMADTGYYEMVRDEMSDKLKNLGHASGLSDEFVDNFVRKLDIIEAEKKYISGFYSGGSTLVDTTEFKQDFLAAIDQYIIDNDIDKEKASEKNLSYLADSAASIYASKIKISFFAIVGNYIGKLESPLRTAEIGLSVAAVVIIAIIFFTNRFKHRRYRYICYGLSGGFLSVLVIPIVVFALGIIPKVNFKTRSLYNLFVGYLNAFFANFWIYAVILLFLSVLTFVLYRRHYLKAISH